MKARHKIEENDAELSLGLILLDGCLFSQFFQKADLSMEMTIPQKVMFCDSSRRLLLCTSRNVGKTVGMIGRILRELVTYLPRTPDTQEEILVCTPAEAHLTPLIDRLFAMITKNPFFSSLISSWNRGDKPKIITKTGLVMQARIEGSSGTDTNMVGIHPRAVYLDEASFGNQTCHRSRIGGAMPETRWVYSGVPNGVRGTPFYLLDQTKEGRSWSRHKFSMLTANPRFLTSKSYRKEMTDAFGGKTSPDYITQVKGEWGDEAMSSFPPGSVSWNTEQPYYICIANGSTVSEHLANNSLPALLRIPQVQCYRACLGIDAGYSPDPATYIIGVQYKENDPWKTYARISLFQVSIDKQILILKYLWQFVMNNKCVMLSVDSQPYYQLLLSDENKYLFEGRAKLTLQGGTVEMDLINGKIITESMLANPEIAQHKKEGKIVKAGRKYFLTEYFRRLMMNQMLKAEGEPQLEVSYDAELESELMSTIERKLPSGHTVYEVPRGRAPGHVNMDQITDGVRALVDSICEIESRYTLEPFDLSGMIDAFGWSRGGNREQDWTPPWEH